MEGDVSIDYLLGRPDAISIHSLRMEGDVTPPLYRMCGLNFNPLPPHGGRPACLLLWLLCRWHFNPLPPHGGRLLREVCRNERRNFNPLPPHGGRLSGKGTPCCVWDFNPLPPHGGRQRKCTPQQGARLFQSTPSAWRETWERRHMTSSMRFQSTPSAWRETAMCPQQMPLAVHFNPLPPHGGRRRGSGPMCSG